MPLLRICKSNIIKVNMIQAMELVMARLILVPFPVRSSNPDIVVNCTALISTPKSKLE
jgi:hypothetical protein